MFSTSSKVMSIIPSIWECIECENSLLGSVNIMRMPVDVIRRDINVLSMYDYTIRVDTRDAVAIYTPITTRISSYDSGFQYDCNFSVDKLEEKVYNVFCEDGYIMIGVEFNGEKTSKSLIYQAIEIVEKAAMKIRRELIGCGHNI